MEAIADASQTEIVLPFPANSENRASFMSVPSAIVPEVPTASDNPVQKILAVLESLIDRRSLLWDANFPSAGVGTAWIIDQQQRPISNTLPPCASYPAASVQMERWLDI